MALIDFEVHNNEIQERNALIQEARDLLTKLRELDKPSSAPWGKVNVDVSKAVTKFLNDSNHAKYEYIKPEKKI